MQALKFTLEGKSAFFKKPDVNTYLYFTYGHIHKIALLGILGAILGYKGYNQMSREMFLTKKEIDFPEFYSKLKDLKIGIIPNNKKGIINKKVNKFNNSVGYASKEQGGNLIVTEQWLERPSWDIYILLDSDEVEKIKQSLLNKSYVFLPYLGKNDHPADILNVQLLEAKKVISINKIDSFFIKNNFKFMEKIKDDFDMDEEEVEEDIPEFKYEEKMPIALSKETNGYILDSLVFTNRRVDCIVADNIIYDVNGKVIQFI